MRMLLIGCAILSVFCTQVSGKANAAHINKTMAKGVAYAESSGTTWTLSDKKDPMTGKLSDKAISIQENDKVKTKTIATCMKQGSMLFYTDVWSSNGSPFSSLPGQTWRHLDIDAFVRHNNDKAHNMTLKHIEFRNQFIVTELMSDREYAHSDKDMTQMAMALTPIVRMRNTWRVLVQINTPNGKFIVVIPPMNKSLLKLRDRCKKE